ncbi:PREDICTED: uncharacterized protein LOC106747228 [Dinoponera quadriceps]|uniref:Uncharacterized protein LOC106747228 n=1 Tax=Dinoponera quadriceps TaxID=609295 RepID=A0A6P3XQ25_DINQU|nr:PREDICTED: uncharacterized protein LOC106747228 [Dinoponera quadriceps]
MSQDYQHACERAELLGLPRPTEEEWRKTQAAEGGNRNSDDDALQDLDYTDETTGRIGGGLDELNSILSTTQKKLNRFKNVCGSLGTLLKVKVGSRGGTPHHKPEDPDAKQEAQQEPGSAETAATEAADDVMTVETAAETNPESGDVQPRHIDLNEKMGSHLDKLDSLISKAENAQYSMQHQTKQMRKFMKN